MGPRMPATLQYSLTIAASCWSLNRPTNAFMRSSRRAFDAKNERSTTPIRLTRDGRFGFGTPPTRANARWLPSRLIPHRHRPRAELQPAHELEVDMLR